MIARIEGGHAGTIPAGKLDRIAQALDARLDLKLNWNGEALDRLLDGDHAGLVDQMADRLKRGGWVVAAEVTFWIRGERGSVDLLAWHAASRILLVVEIKSVVPDIQAMLASLDRKVRLGFEIARQRGWAPVAVGKLLVVGESRTARRRIEAHATTFRAEFPHRGLEVRRFIEAPGRNVPSRDAPSRETPSREAPGREVPLRGLLFLSPAQGVSPRHRVRRVVTATPARATKPEPGSGDKGGGP